MLNFSLLIWLEGVSGLLKEECYFKNVILDMLVQYLPSFPTSISDHVHLIEYNGTDVAY